jgi:hypothetical protein
MSRRGRERWSTRPLVEDCLALDIANLVRASVFRARPGTLCFTAWKNPSEKEIFCAYFWVELTASGNTFLHISYGVPSSRPLMQYAQNQIIEIVKTQLHFGPRPWFLCPGICNNAPCRNRVRILYFPPSAGGLGCRKCLNLIHRSARQHDKRIDALLRLSPEEFGRVLTDANIGKALLAVRAGIIQIERLRQKAAKYAFAKHTRRNSKFKLPTIAPAQSRM